MIWDLSLGKLNYVLKSLKDKGHIKINNFKNNKNKINYLYLTHTFWNRRKKQN